MTRSDHDDLAKKLSSWTVVPASDPNFSRAVWRRIAARQAGDEKPEPGLDQISATLGQLPLES
jgi:hypothetical protein